MSEQTLQQMIEEERFSEAWAKEIRSLLDERRMAPAIYGEQSESETV